MITKNILYKYFKDFADNHLQIKDYGYGDLWEISSSQATTYPLFWVSPQPSNISGNEISYNFNILIGDRLEDGDANKVEVESDTFQIGLDLLATLNLDRELDLDKNNTLTPFIHDFKDRIAGHLITLSVSAPFDYNECAVPTTGIPQPPATSCPSAFITINGVDYGSVISGGTEDILVVDGSGNEIGSLVSGNWVVTSSCPNATAILKDSAGTTISTTSIASGASSNITAPDGSAVLKNTLNTTLSTTSILSNGSSNITAPDSTAVIKDDSGNVLKTSVIPSNVSQDVIINDSSAVLKNTLATTLSTTSINAESSANITAPDSTITINSASFSTYPSGATSNILVKDTTGASVGSKVGSDWIVPEGASTGDYLVRFFDIDGTILKEEYVDSGNSATAPSNPTYDSTYLTFYGWNQSLTNIQNDLDIGAIYDTIDGKTYLFIRVNTNTGLQPAIRLNKSTTALMTINWGDSTTNTTSSSGDVIITKTSAYASVGDYIVSIECSGGYGVNSGGYILGSNTTYSRTLLKAYMGANITTIGSSMFRDNINLSIISIPNIVTTSGFFAFQECNNLLSLALPLSLTSINNNTFVNCYSMKIFSSSANIGGSNQFQNCRSLEKIVINSGVTTLSDFYLSGTSSLKSVKFKTTSVTTLGVVFSGSGIETIIIPNSVTSFAAQAFQNCVLLKSITIPNAITSLGAQTFISCTNLQELEFPNTLTSISAQAFQSCTSMLEYTFLSTTPPTLGATSAFTGIQTGCKIYVPDASVSAYQSATNWSTYATYIYPLSTKP
jgi:hypothetical protein